MNQRANRESRVRKAWIAGSRGKRYTWTRDGRMRNVRPDNQSESETETRDRETDDDVLVDLVMIMMMCHMNDWLACLYLTGRK